MNQNLIQKVGSNLFSFSVEVTMNKKGMLFLLLVIALLAVAASACTPDVITAVELEPEAAKTNSGLTMAERIQFKDELAEREVLVAATDAGVSDVSLAERIAFQDKLAAEQPTIATNSEPTLMGMSLGERIAFQDQVVEGALGGEDRSNGNSGLTQAERIRFQDQIWQSPK